MLVTPEQAARWLTTAPQRQLDGLKIRMYAAALNAGEWHDRGTPWIVRNGMLLDGNHRAYALLLYGQPAEMPVTFV
jgi:hypothetical protein